MLLAGQGTGKWEHGHGHSCSWN